MRAREFLSEAGLGQRELRLDKHGGLYLDNLIKAASQGPIQVSPEYQADYGTVVTLHPSTIDELKAYKAGGPFPNKPKLNFINTNTNQLQQIPWGAIFKSADIKGREFQVRTKGLVNEALLGIAMYAKLTARGGPKTGTISAQEVWDVVDQIQNQSPQTIQLNVNDVNNQVSDNIYLKMAVAVDVLNVLLNQNYRAVFKGYLNSILNYVNSDLAQLYSDKLYKNNRPDNITIEMVGGAGGKIDVKINVLDPSGKATSKKQQLALSVKMSNALIGQKARGTNVQEVFDNLQNLFEPLGVNLQGTSSDIINAAAQSGIKNQFSQGVNIAYGEAYTQLKAILSNTNGDAILTANLAKFLKQHSTGDDDGVHVIELGEVNYRLLSYGNLKDFYKHFNINIDVIYNQGTTQKYPGQIFPSLTFFDKNSNFSDSDKKDSKEKNIKTSKEKGIDESSNVREKIPSSSILVTIRYRARGDYANHIVEPGDLIKEIAAYRRFRKK